MVRRYKEIVYGLLLGVGALLIDTVMHARMAERGLWAELFQPQAGMLLYRVLYVALGIVVGWSLWQRNKRERDFRRLSDLLARFHSDIAGPASVIHAKVEVLLTREDFRFPAEAEEMLRYIYDNSKRMAALAKENLPVSLEK